MIDAQSIQWFPGHMAKTRRLMAANLKMVDIVVEITDARIPQSSRNPEIDRMLGQKPRLILLNKCDVADPNLTARWCEYYRSKGILAIPTDCKSGRGLNEIIPGARQVLDENMPYFGYGYIKDPNSIVPNVWLSFWSFRVMVGLGMYFIAFFILILVLAWKHQLSKASWLHWIALWSIPLAYIASQAGWIVAEVGRQPWAIQDLLPVNAAISRLETGSVQTTFFIFLIMFTVLLIAEIGIMLKAIKKGPEEV